MKISPHKRYVIQQIHSLVRSAQGNIETFIENNPEQKDITMIASLQIAVSQLTDITRHVTEYLLLEQLEKDEKQNTEGN